MFLEAGIPSRLAVAGEVTSAVPKLADLAVPVPCPDCSRTTQIGARDVVPGFVVKCAGCGVAFALTDEDIQRLQKGLDDLTQTSRRFGGRQG
jgi:hypothetical protein